MAGLLDDLSAGQYQKVARGLLGPAYEPLAALPGLLGEFSVGADVRDYQDYSSTAIRKALRGDFGQAGLDALWAAAALAGTVLPGSASGYRKLADELPMDEASRMARADDMGFDVDAWHATVLDGDQMFNEFDVEKFGQNTGAKDAKLGAWFTDKPRATEYFGGYSDDMLSDAAVAFHEKTRHISDKYWRDTQALSKRFQDGEISGREFRDTKKVMQADRDAALLQFGDPATMQETVSGFEEGATVMPVKLRGNLLEVDAGVYNPGQFNDVARSAKAEGYDGVRFRGVYDIDEAPVRHDQYVIFDPKNIRSRFAQFDPAKINSPNLLAGAAGLGLLAPVGAYGISGLQTDDGT